jgi:NAD(P)-dependent dehydrogenase (short-subunit alcohol dehydrogenase family)
MAFSPKVVIISGSGKGIGRSIALAYAAEGASVVVAEKDKTEGLKTEAEIGERGGNALFVETDVSCEADIINVVNRAVEKYGRIDIVINNAGFARWKSPYELSAEEWDSVLNTNLRGSFLLAREAARHMRQTGGGSIVNIASTRAFMSEPNSEAYAASKGGILALTHALAASFAPDRIRVNCISPGWIETGDYSQLRDIDHSQHFAQRVGKPEDIARACLFLTAENNDFISGTNLTIDGGMTRKMIYEE